MSSYESPRQPAEKPEELQKFIELYEEIKLKDQPVELHLLALQEISDSLYAENDDFKAILDEEMKGVTDPEFDHESDEEKQKDRAQALVGALSKYAQKFNS